jgi:tetratricopeptide (TPR) repeat protein
MSQGDRLRDRDKPEAALDMYAQAAELRPTRAEPVAGRGLALLDMGNPLAAQAAFEEALRLNARYGPAIMGLAEAFRLQGNHEKAVEYYQRYLDVLPNGAEASVARNNIERLKK